ncbi:helix-turn-helix domain-containing protein [Tomitella biformata]|uniref:helix-turn-helix domain-containing protein n=1 Tax=Tomitella biformata TaxID=630403 RepID=UPI000464C3C2|nr:helix-turn-helix transcriptional regulator [Tomitella biformata]
MTENVENAVAIGTEKVVNTAQDIGSFIRSQRETAQFSLRQLAERAGVSNPYLSQIERGLRKPSAEVLGQIAKGLRMSAEALYVRAGILEQREPSPVRDAVLSDPALTERQRQVVLEVYESFCRENVAVAAATAAVEAAGADPKVTAPVN